MYKNVCILGLFAIFGSVLSLPADTSNSKVDMVCVAEAEITPRELAQYRSLLIGRIYDKKIACYNVCVGKKDGSVNDDGTTSFEYIKEQLGEVNPVALEEIRKVHTKCTDRKIIGDPCKTYYEVVECSINESATQMMDILLRRAANRAGR